MAEFGSQEQNGDPSQPPSTERDTVLAKLLEPLTHRHIPRAEHHPVFKELLRPTRQLHSADQWSAWIHKHLPTLEKQGGNAERAGILMESYMKGVHFAVERRRLGGQSNLTVPRVYISYDKVPNVKPTFVIVADGSIVVNLSELMDNSRRRDELADADHLRLWGYADRSFEFATDFFGLYGVEEGDHYAEWCKGGLKGDRATSDEENKSVPQQQYDAEHGELLSLYARLEYARTKFGPDHAITRTMQARIHRAQVYSGSHSEPPTVEANDARH